MSAPNSSHHHPPKQKESTALPAKPENNFGNLPEDTGLTVEQIRKYYDNRHNSAEDFIRYLCYACTCFKRQRDRDRSKPEFVQHVIELFYAQNGRCAVTDLPLKWDFEDGGDDECFAISIDRIDGYKSYEIGNVRLVCRYTNSALAKTGEQNFWYFIEKITERSGQ